MGPREAAGETHAEKPWARAGEMREDWKSCCVSLWASLQVWSLPASRELCSVYPAEWKQSHLFGADVVSNPPPCSKACDSGKQERGQEGHWEATSILLPQPGIGLGSP